MNGLENIIPDFARVVLDTLHSHVVLLDSRGVIVFYNNAWKKFAENNGFPGPLAGLGTNYFSVCAAAKRPCPEHLEDVEKGIRDILDEKKASFYFEYPCHSDAEQRWFLMRVQLLKAGGEKWILISHDNITERKLLEIEKVQTIIELREAADNIKVLKGMIPVCAWCRKVRNDKGFWNTVERYISEHTDAVMSHGICPECFEKVGKKSGL